MTTNWGSSSRNLTAGQHYELSCEERHKGRFLSHNEPTERSDSIRFHFVVAMVETVWAGYRMQRVCYALTEELLMADNLAPVIAGTS